MAAYTLIINKEKHRVEVAEGTPLLWVLREHLGLTGTKYACGISACGACTVHINGTPVKACVMPVEGAVDGKEITTIEGLSRDRNHVLQKAWIQAQVPQCGYCQSGQIMHAAALLDKNPAPTREEIKQHMNNILCRCGTYFRILKAIEMAAEKSISMK